MAISTYTSYDQVRAVLGVTDDELSDATLALETYDLSLVEDLLEVNSSLEATYATISALAVNARTMDQQRLWRTTRLYATYAVARTVGISLPMFGPKEISDGKSSVTRHSDSPYKTTLANIAREYDIAQANLKSAYAKVSSASGSTQTRTYFAVASPSYDPVTG